jgi:hypothetical protein
VFYVKLELNFHMILIQYISGSNVQHVHPYRRNVLHSCLRHSAETFTESWAQLNVVTALRSDQPENWRSISGGSRRFLLKRVLIGSGTRLAPYVMGVKTKLIASNAAGT